ncbi:MAG: hypothetical protein AAGE76_14345 [Pseudomonadota bacterium]
MILSPVAVYTLILVGLACALAALALRAQEVRHPAPGDIMPKEGLGHMLIGVLAWLAIASVGTVAVFAAGIVLPVLAAALLAILARRADLGGALAPLYRLQLPLAVAALIAALVLWANLVTLLTQGASDA